MVTPAAGGTTGPGPGSPPDRIDGIMDAVHANERTDAFQVEETAKTNRIDQILVISG